ncbi:hypothetical protein P3T76_001485 [Phytophthora citrophthora]|uniref:RxLR effector protein n=1 Tax=Phytophthora citrophthora TaxID=4793 RepID=A0AAD9GZZ2_9STRA|nr:hypothetical protein P3T76_001485 [Phytophthora citrophthora]
MRCFVYIALALAVFARSNGVEAFTNTDLSSKITPGFAANEVDYDSPRKRFLRVNHPENAAGEERTKISSLEMITKRLDKENAKAKKLATIKKVKDLAQARRDARLAELVKTRKDAQKLAAAANVVKSKPQRITTKFSSMEYDNFMRLFKNNLTPEMAKSRGKIKSSGQFARYEDFYERAKAADILTRMAHA